MEKLYNFEFKNFEKKKKRKKKLVYHDLTW